MISRDSCLGLEIPFRYGLQFFEVFNGSNIGGEGIVVTSTGTWWFWPEAAVADHIFL